MLICITNDNYSNYDPSITVVNILRISMITSAGPNPQFPIIPVVLTSGVEFGLDGSNSGDGGWEGCGAGSSERSISVG